MPGWAPLGCLGRRRPQNTLRRGPAAQSGQLARLPCRQPAAACPPAACPPRQRPPRHPAPHARPAAKPPAESPLARFSGRPSRASPRLAWQDSQGSVRSHGLPHPGPNSSVGAASLAVLPRPRAFARPALLAEESLGAARLEASRRARFLPGSGRSLRDDSGRAGD